MRHLISSGFLEYSIKACLESNPLSYPTQQPGDLIENLSTLVGHLNRRNVKSPPSPNWGGVGRHIDRCITVTPEDQSSVAWQCRQGHVVWVTVMVIHDEY